MTTENIDIRVSEDGSRVVRRNIRDIGDDAAKSADSVDRLNNILGSVAKFLGVREIMRWADAWSTATSSIKIATSSMAEAIDVQDKLFASAQRSRQEFGAMAELYAAVARQSEPLKKSQGELLAYTENIAKALAIQHTSMQAARGPLLQLGQAMGSGTIRAQEFNSIMLGLPYVMKVAAENFKGGAISVMQLRQMMLQGKLESKEFFEAFQRGSEQINKDFTKTQITFSQAFTIFRNEVVKFTGTMDSSIGAAATFASALKVLADNLTLVAGSFAALAAGKYLAPWIAKIGELRKESVALASVQAASAAAQQQQAISEAANAAAALRTAEAVKVKTAAELAGVQATQATIVVTREAALAALAKSNADITSATSMLNAAKSAGALSYAIAMRTEAELALAAAEARRSATMTELAALGQAQARITVIQTEATAAHAVATRALAAAQGLSIETTVASTAAATANAAATARSGVAATAAGVASKALGGVLALFGGWAGVAITALAGVAMWLWNIKSNADQAKDAIAAMQRVQDAAKNGGSARESDIEVIQRQLNVARKELEAVEDRGRNIANNASAQARYAATLSVARNQVDQYTSALEKARDISEATGGAVGKAARDLGQAKAEWDGSISNIKTATTVQEKYTQQLTKSQDAYKKYVGELRKSNEGGVNDKEIAAAQSRQAEVEKQIEKEKQAELKSIRNKGGADKVKEARLEADERLSVLRTTIDNELGVQKTGFDSAMRLLADKHRNGLISEETFQAQNLQLVQRYEAEQKATLVTGLEDYVKLYTERYAKIMTTLKGQPQRDALERLNGDYQKFVDGVNSKLNELDTTAFERQESALNKLGGELNKFLEKNDKYWDRASANAKKDLASANAKQRLAFATAAEQAAYEAAETAGAKYESQIEKIAEATFEAEQRAMDFGKAIDWSTAGQDSFKVMEALVAQAEKYGLTLEEAIDRMNKLKEQAAEAARNEVLNKEYNRNVASIADGITTAIFDGGKAGGQKLRDWLVNYFIRNPINVMLQGIVGSVFGSGGILGGAGGGGGGGGVGGILNLASSANTVYGMMTSFAGYVGKTVGMLFGQAAGNTATGMALGLGSSSSVAAANGAAAAGGGASSTISASAFSNLGAAGIAAAVVALFMNATGFFRSEKRVANGLTGTLGEGNISSYENWRTGGTLFSGPRYRMKDPAAEVAKYEEEIKALRAAGLGASEQVYELEAQLQYLKDIYGDQIAAVKQQSTVIQGIYDGMRNNVGDMADVLGISSEAVRKFTMSLGSDVINQETGQLGMSFTDLSDEEIAKKIEDALNTANNTLAEQVIGTWKEVTETIRTTVQTGTQTNNDTDYIPATFREDVETITRLVYVQSEYAREGEKAIDTLTRLASSLTAVNTVFETLGLTMFEASLAGGDMASKLIDLFGGMEQFADATGKYYNDFYTEAEKRAKIEEQLTQKFKEQNLVLPKNREEYKKLVDEYSKKLDTEEGRKMFAFLIQLAPAFAQISDAIGKVVDDVEEIVEEVQSITRTKDEVKALLQSNTDAAWQALQDSINSEMDRIDVLVQASQERISKLRAIFEMAADALKNLLGSVDTVVTQNYENSRAYLSRAASTKNVDAEQLEAAIAGINAGLTTSRFTNKFDYELAQMQTAADLTKIRDNAGKQLTNEEKTLAALEGQLEYWKNLLAQYQAQMDVLRGISTGIKSFADAFTAWTTATSAEAAYGGKTPAGSGKPAGANQPAWGGSAPSTDTPPEKARYSQVFNMGTAGVGYEPITDRAMIARLDLLAPIYHAFDGTGDLLGLLNTFKAAGGKLSDLSILSGNYLNDWIKAAASVGIPAFAEGGMHSGGLRVVGERGWELEATGAARYWNQNQLSKALTSNSWSDMDDEDSSQSVSSAVISSNEDLKNTMYGMLRQQTILLSSMESLMRKDDKIGIPPTRAATPEPTEEIV